VQIFFAICQWLPKETHAEFWSVRIACKAFSMTSARACFDVRRGHRQNDRGAAGFVFELRFDGLILRASLESLFFD